MLDKFQQGMNHGLLPHEGPPLPMGLVELRGSPAAQLEPEPGLTESSLHIPEELKLAFPPGSHLTLQGSAP